jgi:hypothetical protein
MKSKFLVMFWAFFLLIGGMSFYLPRYPILLIPFILLCFAAPLSIIMMAKSGNNAEKLLKNGGVKTTARIVNVQDTGMTMNNINIGIRLTLEVASVTGSPFQAQAETFVSRVSIPRVGDVVEVVYNPSDTSQVAVVMA